MSTVIVTMNGQRSELAAGVSLLEASRALPIEIPSLCHHAEQTHTPTSELCALTAVDVTDPQGNVTTRNACCTPTDQLAGCSIQTQSSALNAQRQQLLTQVLQDHFADCEAPCQTACPAGVDVQQYVYHIAQGNHREAVRVLKQTLPLPLSIGRVCPAFCETECRRNLVDESIAIRQLKRHAADLDLADDDPWLPERAPATGKKVAIVGAGPAGLAAGYFLSNQGHEVELFDAMPKAGGWLRYGIPEYRLPKAILDKEIELLCRNGMIIHTEQRLGRDFQLNGLITDYDAVCLAIGAQKAAPMHYTGSDLQGCYLGVDFLREHALARDEQRPTRFAVGKKVAVIGGGNTAIDCARTALREGAEVTLIYRRTKDEMPAEAYEIHEAEIEGVQFHLLTNPIENHADENGRVQAVTFEKMALGEPDSSGRRSPIATGETFTEAFDTVIAAVSQLPDFAFLTPEATELFNGELALTRWNTLDGCQYTMSAGVEKLFSIGDSRQGPATAVAAIGDGQRAAKAIHTMLTEGLICDLNPRPFNAQKAKSLKALKQAQAQLSNQDLYPTIVRQPRVKMPELSIAQRALNFMEVETGFVDQQAMQEAKRCLECACQANTRCKLREYATEYRVDNQAIVADNSQSARRFAVDTTAPFITFDANRCISCGACVEMCQTQTQHKAIQWQPQLSSVQGVPTLGKISQMTLEAKPTARLTQLPRSGFNISMADSDCVQCGNCVQVCPTGALVDARHKAQGERVALKQTSTVCTYCGVGCRVILHVDPSTEQVKFVTGDKRSPVNQGQLCVKGRYGFDFLNSPERLTTPLVRKHGELQPASWQEAIEVIAGKLKPILAEHGGRSVATLASAKATNEENYLLQKFTRTVLGSNNIDHCARLCHASTVSALRETLGSGAMTGDIPSIAQSDVIFILGSDTKIAHPIIASHIERAVENGARLIVADPKKITIADKAMLYVRQKPSSDVMLLNAIMQQILINNWQDDAYIATRTENFEALKAELMQDIYSLENAEKITGVAASDIAEMARIFGTAEKVGVYYAMGITQHSHGHDNVLSISNLQLLLGNIGVIGGGINPLRGQSNVQGSCDMGALPNYLPGYQRVDNDALRAPFEAAWGMKLDPQIGLATSEMMHALSEGKLKALYVMGENPVLSDPDQAHVLKGLAAAELLVVQDIFLTETAKLADVVLPAAAFAEKQGHFTNTERRVQRLVPAKAAPGSALADWQIVQLVANALGAAWDYQDEQQIWQELIALTPQYRGMDWSRLSPIDNIHGLQWPCPDPAHQGTANLHQQQFIRGLAKFAPVQYRLPAELPDQDYPFILSTGRLLEQFHTGTLTRKTQGLNGLAQPHVLMSAIDADRLGLNNGDRVKLSTRRGEIEVELLISKRGQVGVLFLPFHFAESAANKLTNNALDPVAKIPEFKFCAVQVEALHVSECLA